MHDSRDSTLIDMAMLGFQVSPLFMPIDIIVSYLLLHY